MIKIGVFGGAFNPIHNGHVNMVKEAFTDLKLQKMQNFKKHKMA